MKLLLLVVGKTDVAPIATLIEEYRQRICRYISFEIEVIPDPKNRASRTAEELRTLEGNEILSRLQPSDKAFLLDERGNEYTSTQLAELLRKAFVAGGKRIVWIIGGPYGFSPQVYERVPGRISLSQLTFTHTMVRLFAVEQIYRVCTIWNNEPYHHT